MGVIENKPGSAGSVRVYSYLMDIFGALIPHSIKIFPQFQA
jgi:hypothetical protein